MSNHFCVFWYPTIFHREKRHRDIATFDKESKPIFHSIADIDPKDIPGVIRTDLALHIEEKHCKENKRNEECFDLVFTLQDKVGKKKVKTVFHHHDHSRNGFVIYRYDRDQLLNDFWNNFLDKEIIEEAINTLRSTFSIRIKERYSIELKEPLSDECVKNHTIDWLLISFYHLAKSFYHEHEVHSDADAKLESYYYRKIDSKGCRDYLIEPPSLSTKNNPVINRYLDQYEQMFLNYAEKISQDYRQRKNDIEDFLTLRKNIIAVLDKDNPTPTELIELITNLRATFDEIASTNAAEVNNPLKYNTPSAEYGKLNLPGVDNTPPPTIEELINEKKPSSIDIKTLQEELEKRGKEVYLPFVNRLYTQISSLSKICHNALIEYTYCRTLLGSKYNDDYKHDSLFTQSEVEYLSENPFPYSRLSIRDDRRKKAFNIRNSIRYIEDIRQKCSLLESTLTKILIEEVHGISKDNTDILSQVTNLTKGNTDILSEVKGLTRGNTIILSEVKGLTKENTDILSQIEILEQKNTETLTSSEKSNRLSYALGFLSLGFGIVSLIRPEEGNEIITIVLRVFGALSFVAAVCFGISTLFVSKENKSRKD